jgi:xeroderma pigmentosum group C-complementing protein
LTGFEFRGRHGTAILKGVVVAVEYREAVEAVIEGFRDEQAQSEKRRRTLNALRMWKRFLHSLRIKERVDGYDVEGDEPDVVQDDDAESAGPRIMRDEDDDEDMKSDGEYIDDDGGGGFIPE